MTVTPAPLVGRDAELRAVDRLLGDDGAPRVLGITGEPGIGKSRLLAEVRSRAAALGQLVLAARAAELERDVPFALWSEALPAGTPPLLGEERLGVARIVRTVLERLGASQPVTLALDDVQWADPASAELLTVLLQRMPRADVRIALAARVGRAPVVEGTVQALAQVGDAALLEVGPLPRQAADALLGPGVLGTVRERLFRESGGNPFFLEALARAGPSAATGGVEAGATPAAVVAALAGEIAALEPSAREFVRGAAVAGDPFEPSLAAAAAGIADDAAPAALDAVLAADLVRASEHPWRFVFRHPLVRRAVYASASEAWRLAAHERAADALAARGASPVERAHHAARAARPGDLAAVDLLAEAAGEAGTGAPATAAAWLAVAERLLPAGPSHEPRRLALLSSRAMALASAGRAVEARDVLEDLCGRLPENAPERVIVVAMLAELMALWTQQPDEARALLEREREAVGASPGAVGVLSLVMARERAVNGDHAAAETLASGARVAARTAGDAALEAEAAAIAADAAQCRLRRDDPAARAEADARIAEAAELVAALPDEALATRLQAPLWLSVAHFFTGRFTEIVPIAERAVRVARASGQGLYLPTYAGLRAWVDAELGELGRAEEGGEAALESALLTGNAQVVYWTHVVLSRVSLARGDVEAALSHGRAAWDRLGLMPYSQAGYALADAQLAAGDPHAACATFETFGWVNPAMWTFDRVKASHIAVRALIGAGRVDEAAAIAEQAPAEGSGRRDGVFGAVLALAAGDVAMARGEPARAARLASVGATQGDSGAVPLWAARCRVLAGEALAADGRGDEARAVLRRAAADLDARGAFGYRDEALRVLRRLGERPRPAVASGGPALDTRLESLTAREREVALLVAEGRTNAQIAARLRLSESTVEKHVSRVLAKLGAGTRSGVIALLAREPASPG